MALICMLSHFLCLLSCCRWVLCDVSNIIFEAIGVTWRLTDPRLRSVIVKNWVQFSKLRGIFTILYWPLYYHSAGKRDRGQTQPQRGWVCPREGGEAPKKSWNEKSWKRSWNEKVVKRLASVVILNKSIYVYDYGKIAIFRYLKIHLNIDVDPPKLVLLYHRP